MSLGKFIPPEVTACELVDDVMIINSRESEDIAFEEQTYGVELEVPQFDGSIITYDTLGSQAYLSSAEKLINDEKMTRMLTVVNAVSRHAVRAAIYGEEILRSGHVTGLESAGFDQERFVGAEFKDDGPYELLTADIFKHRTFYDGKRTLIGSVLSATSIDELPQVENIANQDIALTGVMRAIAIGEFNDMLEELDSSEAHLATIRMQSSLSPEVIAFNEALGREYGPSNMAELLIRGFAKTGAKTALFSSREVTKTKSERGSTSGRQAEDIQDGTGPAGHVLAERGFQTLYDLAVYNKALEDHIKNMVLRRFYQH